MNLFMHLYATSFKINTEISLLHAIVCSLKVGLLSNNTDFIKDFQTVLDH
jgi:hypothetical protein